MRKSLLQHCYHLKDFACLNDNSWYTSLNLLSPYQALTVELTSYTVKLSHEQEFCSTAYRNVRVKTSSAQYIGIWHAEVLSMGLEQGYPGTDQVRSSLKLLIGEPGPAGFTSDMQVPWVPGYAPKTLSRSIGVLSRVCYP